MVIFHKKSHQRACALDLAFGRLSGLASPPTIAAAACALGLDDATLFSGTLDPAAGDLNADRAQRKRQQIRSAASHALGLLEDGMHCVEFGAGSGHLGLLIASLRPQCRVTLVEVKQHTCDIARGRIAAANLSNVCVFEGSVDAFATAGAPFELAIGLHLCGLLSDAVLELATERKARVCVVPCCYGQLAGSEDHVRGGGTALSMHPRSLTYRQNLGEDGIAAFQSHVVKSADCVAVGKGGAFDTSASGFQTARRCMRCVDADRLLWAREQHAYECVLAHPPAASHSPGSVLAAPCR